MAVKKQIEKCVCPVCLKNEMEGGLMCPMCYDRHKNISKEAIKKHKKPVESKLEFAIRRASENLTLLGEEFAKKKEETRVFFGEAHKQVNIECRRADLNFSKEEFLRLVKGRYREIIVKAGQEELYERVEWLKARIRESERKMRWYENLARRKKTEAQKVCVV